MQCQHKYAALILSAAFNTVYHSIQNSLFSWFDCNGPVGPTFYASTISLTLRVRCPTQPRCFPHYVCVRKLNKLYYNFHYNISLVYHILIILIFFIMRVYLGLRRQKNDLDIVMSW